MLDYGSCFFVVLNVIMAGRERRQRGGEEEEPRQAPELLINA